jgi:deoxyribonuclease IV
MIKFGPSGNSDLFYEKGYKHTWQAFLWIHSMGLGAFEYSFGHGVRMKEETAAQIRQEAEKYGVAMSVHAPYYINLAAGEASFEKNLLYIEQSARAARLLGADRVVIHPGSLSKQSREQALANTAESLSKIYRLMLEKGFGDLLYCPETLGKINQVGDLEDIALLCSLGDNIYPAIDFAHLHARSQGGIHGYEDYKKIISFLESTVGREKTNAMHVHFSKVQFTGAGEKMHMLFSDEGYGPDFEPLAQLFVEKNMSPRVICESRGTQATDAVTMMEMYNNAKRTTGKN